MDTYCGNNEPPRRKQQENTPLHPWKQGPAMAFTVRQNIAVNIFIPYVPPGKKELAYHINAAI
jgi:hypothetical protein